LLRYGYRRDGQILHESPVHMSGPERKKAAQFQQRATAATARTAATAAAVTPPSDGPQHNQKLLCGSTGAARTRKYRYDVDAEESPDVGVDNQPQGPGQQTSLPKWKATAATTATTTMRPSCTPIANSSQQAYDLSKRCPLFCPVLAASNPPPFFVVDQIKSKSRARSTSVRTALAGLAYWTDRGTAD
jgi:hypothetical protein